jgi:hypothetical protein
LKEEKLDRIDEVLFGCADRVFAFDEFGPLAIRPIGGCCWAAKKKPQQLGANYHKHCGVRQFHGCYSLGDDRLWGVVRAKKGIHNSLAAIKSCRAARPDGEMIYVILDNLSAHKATKIKAWCDKNNVELCFTPTYSSWANPIECHFGPLRDFVLNNSDHPNHTVLTGRLHAYLRWRNEHDSDPAMRERLRKERARLRSERQRRFGRPASAALLPPLDSAGNVTFQVPQLGLARPGAAGTPRSGPVGPVVGGAVALSRGHCHPRKLQVYHFMTFQAPEGLRPGHYRVAVAGLGLAATLRADRAAPACMIWASFLAAR